MTDYGSRHERRALALALGCHGLLFASYYVLRGVRDTLATVYGAGRLPWLFTATFVCTLLAAPLYSALTARWRLQRLLPALFWFWWSNIALFMLWLHSGVAARWIAAVYFVWFSVANLYIVSVFWSLMAEIFTPEQATRRFGAIAAAGSLGAILGPLLTRSLATRAGLDGLLLIAAGGWIGVSVLVMLLVREKDRLRQLGWQTQASTLERPLPGDAWAGVQLLAASPHLRRQAWFMLLATWSATIAYFQQTDLVARSAAGLGARAESIADIDLVVNVLTAIVLVAGWSGLVRTFGVTASLAASPVVMVLAFAALALAPTLRVLQLVQIARRTSQYAIARPSRELCFTVLDQQSRYQAKNVVDTVVYRFGDLSAAWLQAGVTLLGFGLLGSVVGGVVVALLWLLAALALGRSYAQLRGSSGA